MKAKIQPGYNPNRQKLAEIIPINTPFTLNLAVTHLCNFRCNYCAHSLPQERKEQIGLTGNNIDFNLFLKIINDSKAFNKRYKKICFTGMGEPLMNKRFTEIVKIITESSITERTELFTNAALLTPELSDKIVDSGLSMIRISVQGTNAEKYKKHSNANINFDEFVKNIKYFYNRSRGKCEVYIKVLDKELDGKNDEEKFYKIFGDICDQIYIEKLINAQSAMGDYNGITNQNTTIYNTEIDYRKICHQIFYFMQIDVFGNVFPCSPLTLPAEFSLGNVNENSLYEIWNGQKLNNLRIQHLKKGKLCKTCTECMSNNTIRNCNFAKEDNIDNDAERLLKIFEEKEDSLCHLK